MLAFIVVNGDAKESKVSPTLGTDVRNGPTGRFQAQTAIIDVPREKERESMDDPQYVVRRITPVEAERLQGFPDNYTNIEFKGKPAPDTARYKALGNSMTVNVMAWIAKRILMVEKGEL